MSQNIKRIIIVTTALVVAVFCCVLVFLRKSRLDLHEFSDRAETFTISQDRDFPLFNKELVIDPFRVKNGDEQFFSVWVEDPGGIERVIAEVSTDKEGEILELQLIEGESTHGRWMGSWIVRDVLKISPYSTKVRAFNEQGQETSFSQETSFICFWYVE